MSTWVWYRTGTFSLPSNSSTVTGVLTAFTAGCKVGDAIMLPSGALLEIGAIVSNTQITLKQPYTGTAIAAGTPFVSLPLSPRWDYSGDLAVDLRNLLAELGTVLTTSGAPSASQGGDSAMAYDPAANLVYFKTGGVWGAAISIVGPISPSSIRYDAAQSLTDTQQGQARTNIGAVSALFSKTDSASVAFLTTGATTASIKASTSVKVGTTVVTFATQTAIIMPALVAGTDYAVYVCADGSIRADASFTAPTGYTSANSLQIGGFHYAPGGNAAAQAGGNATPAINPYSMWDLKWRPSCADPRGMTLVAGKFWCDIYLLGVNHYANGTSRYNVSIASGAAPPKVAEAFGGNGTTAYSGLTWWQASECLQSAGKDLLSVGEFGAAAYGTTEASSGGTDPGSTILRQAFTSKWGVMLASGNYWIWGRDWNMRWDGVGGWAWRNNAEGRGQQYIGGDANLVAALLGGGWGGGAGAGSRSSGWSNYPWDSVGNIGARGRCDHLTLV